MILALAALFIFRLVYGLSSEFWFIDQLQVFLIGLKFYSSHLWPYFGPDLVYTETQIPGALLGLLVGLPLFIFPSPESSFIFVNVLTFGSLSFFAWYTHKRIPELPGWFVWLFIMTSPWTLFNGTGVFNLSFLLAFSVVFFICFIDSVFIYKDKIIPENLSFFLTGLTLGCAMQLHLSWVLLMPFIAYNFFQQLIHNQHKVLYNTLWVITGFVIPLAMIAPTFIEYGLYGTGGTEKNIIFNISNFKNIFIILARFLSFAAFEVPYVLGPDTASRVAVVKNHIWMAPFTIFLLPAGIIQVLYYIYSFFTYLKKINNSKEESASQTDQWKKIIILTLSSFLLIFSSFFFSVKGPASHTFYIMLPIAMFYAFHTYSLLVKKTFFKKLALLYFICGFIFHAGLILDNFNTRSIYKDRQKVQKAIDEKNYKILGIRRSDIWGRGY